MKILQYLFFFFFGSALWQQALAEDYLIHAGDWEIRFDKNEKTFDFDFSNKQILSAVFAEVSYTSEGSEEVHSVRSTNYPTVTINQEAVSDNFGVGMKYTFSYVSENLPNLMHCIYVYDHLPYFLIELYISDKNKVSTNYMAPMVSKTGISFLPNSVDNRMLMIPYDNDAWVRYESKTLTGSVTSFEATAVFNAETRNGLILGSVEHNVWKSGLEIWATNNERLDSLRCFSGITHALTRDSQSVGTIRKHGSVSGQSVKSAKMFVGFFDDWRKGLESFGQANLKVQSQRAWKGGTPFGWNSWGVMAEQVTYAGVQSVSAFYRSQLFDKGFTNDSVVWISLDAYARDHMTDFLLKRLIADCKARGQKVGAYWTPFAEWAGDGEAKLPGSAYKNSDCYLRLNGVPMKLDNGWCLDPTHPGIKAHIAYQLAYYKKMGFKYIKLDFLTNAALEADSHYNAEVTTGTQAYNEGMQCLVDNAGDDMFLVLGICPIFPYQYGNSRRISCDAWSDINSTQYVMNSLSYGWWLNQLYNYNDPDHLVMVKSGIETFGTNRARVTSGAITGLFIFADNFSLDGPEVGYPEISRERALTLMTNKDILDIARIGRSFMPVEGAKAAFNGAENLFMHQTKDYLYVACINYSNRTIYGTIPLHRLNVLESDIDSIKELWTGVECSLKDGGLYYQVPFSDARVYRLKMKSTSTSLNELNLPDKHAFSVYPMGFSDFGLSPQLPVSEITILNSQGQLILKKNINALREIVINAGGVLKGFYLIRIRFEDGAVRTGKVIF